MKIDLERCTGCGVCQPYCPTQAIYFTGNGKAAIERDACVECGVCYLTELCTSHAISPEVLTWPRSVRAAFSNPCTVHVNTMISGRGTEEIKTNDATNRYPAGKVGVAIELGRPSIGTPFREVEKVTKLIAKIGGRFVTENPTTSLVVDRSTGDLDPSILDEKVLSAIVECLIPIEDLNVLLKALRNLSPKVNTVFSVNICSRLTANLRAPYDNILRELNLSPAPNGKMNLGFASR